MALNGAKYTFQVAPDLAVDECYVDFVNQPVTDADGKPTGISSTASM